MQRARSLLFLSVMAIGTLAPAASADTLHVPGDYATIQEAIDAANPGDVVEVGPGEYHESIVINKAVTVRGAGPDQTAIYATDTHAAQTTDMTGARLEGFELVGSGQGVVVMVEGPGSAADAEITGNVITGSTTGIQYYASSGLASGNIFTDLTSDSPLGISCMNGSSPRIINNVFIRTSGVMSYYNSSPEVVNNTFIEGDIAIEFRAFFDGAVSEPWIINNIIVGSSTGLKSLNGAVASEISTNLLWDVATKYDAVPTPPTDMELEPIFANASADDYHLLQGSPGIDMGSSGPLVPDTDLDGTPRPLDGDGDTTADVDVGAYEYDPSGQGGAGATGGGGSGGTAGAGGGGSGGSGGTTTGTGGSSAAASDTDTDSGCGCRTVPTDQAPSALWLLAALALLRRRRPTIR